MIHYEKTVYLISFLAVVLVLVLVLVLVVVDVIEDDSTAGSSDLTDQML